MVRLLVAGFLILGPATDEPAELAGWDAERFQEIVDRTAEAWVEQPVEYPPGSVVVLDRLAGPDVVSTHRRLVALSAMVDLAMAAALWRRLGAAPAVAFLWLGLPLVPLGYQRLDTLVTAAALVGALGLLAGTGSSAGAGGRGRPAGPGVAADAVAATAIAAGALTKIWPAVLVVGAVAIGRRRAAIGAALLGALGGGAWVLAAGAGLDPVDQVLSLRGATGWHVESLPGALVALVSDEPARLELDAFRIGTLRPPVVMAGRVVAVVILALAVAASRRSPADTAAAGEVERRLALVVLAGTTALLVTAPLLSPQFLVWTTPWAALLVTGRSAECPEPAAGTGPVVALAAVTAVLTGATLTVFGPDGLASWPPALLLTVRNLALVALIGACLRALRSGRAPVPGQPRLRTTRVGHATDLPRAHPGGR